MNKLDQRGFGVVEFLLILAVIGIVGFVGWRLYDANKSEDPAATTTTQTSNETAIQKAEDLDQETTELNSEDIDAELDTSELDAALN